jgi:hypothetical protein
MSRIPYEVDEEMVGEIWDGFDLIAFCERLQAACNEQGVEADIIPIVGSNGARGACGEVDPIDHHLWGEVLDAYYAETAKK